LSDESIHVLGSINGKAVAGLSRGGHGSVVSMLHFNPAAPIGIADKMLNSNHVPKYEGKAVCVYLLADETQKDAKQLRAMLIE
jgi:septum formation inhibitor MinC